jgi:putative NADPH-quinone reductase
MDFQMTIHGDVDRPVVLLLAHPRPDSFNHALARQVAGALESAGRRVIFHDLYREGFDPILRPEEAYTSGDRASQVARVTDDPLLRQHRAEIQQADGLLVVHPNWWGKPPAILAGWLDRVLVPGVAYQLDHAGGVPLPLVHLRHLLVLNTGDTPLDRERETFADPLDAIWRNCLAPYVGDPEVDRVLYGPVAGSTDVERQAWLDDAASRTLRLFAF